MIHRADLGRARLKGGLVKPDRSQLQCVNYTRSTPTCRDGVARAHWTAAGIQIDSATAIFQTDNMVRSTGNARIPPGFSLAHEARTQPGRNRSARIAAENPVPERFDLTDAFRALVDVTASGTTVRVMIDTVFVARNRAEIQLSTVAPYALVAQVQAAEPASRS